MAKRAIVLGGGGSRGPYQIGVWRALRQLDVEYSIVTGSSVGTLNGALMVQGDYEAARDMWENLTLEGVVAQPAPDENGHLSPLALIREAVGHGGLDITPLENTVRASIHEDKVRQSPIEFGLVTTRYPLLRPVQLLKDEIPQGELVDFMLASASWFPFFRRRTIDGVDYIDGAYADNLPAELAVRCGATSIIAIDLQGTGIVHAFKRDIPVRYIRSHWKLGDMLVFEPEQAKRNMRLGYQDGLKAYRRLEGNAYAFHLGDSRRNLLTLGETMGEVSRRTGVSLLRQRQRIPRIQELLRYRSSDQRFLRPRVADCSLGFAVTTAAEITGELLQIPPDKIYRLHKFNRLLLEKAVEINRAAHSPTDAALFYDSSQPGHQWNRRSRAVLGRLLGQLREGYETGRLPDAFWRMATISPVEFVAACYLIVLERHYGRPDGAGK